MSPRLYVPTTWPGLAALAADGVLAPEAVETPVLAEGDDEESEYAALMSAADLSAAMAARLGLANRRVVVVTEQGSTTDSPALTVHLGDVVAVHLDTEDRGASADPDDDLAWFAPEEIAHLF